MNSERDTSIFPELLSADQTLYLISNEQKVGAMQRPAKSEDLTTGGVSAAQNGH